MCKMCSVAYAGTAGMFALTSGASLPVAQLAHSEKTTASNSIVEMQTLPEAVKTIKIPQLKEPTWLAEQKAAEAAAGKQATRLTGQRLTVTYDVTTRGAVTANLNEFKQQANQTLNDGRGWAKMGVYFQEVASGGQFTLVLSEASQLPSFSAGCSADYSCNVGRYVIINQDRWLGATPPWNAAGGNLRDYRHMVVNHETGHWLGHGHQNCGGAGQAAPLMQQQSMNLQGCSFNPWPLAGELWSTKLGIR